MTATSSFILRSSGGGHIIDVVDEIFSAVPNAGELSISWQCFGSNGQEKADYSRGVLERFTMRESKDKSPTYGCKCIADPRKIKYMASPHNVELFEGFIPVTENKQMKTCAPWRLEPQFTDKIVVNHYRCMSLEEYLKRAPRGDAGLIDGSKYSMEFFKKVDLNDEFDDGILKYRDEQAKIYQPPDKSRADERLFTALAKNLSPTLQPNTPPEFYAGKMETFLTCRAVSSYLRTKLTDETPAKFFEEASLKAILQSISQMSFADARFLFSELPELLALPYPAVEVLREVCLGIIPQIMDVMHLNYLWKDYVELDYINRLLKLQK